MPSRRSSITPLFALFAIAAAISTTMFLRDQSARAKQTLSTLVPEIRSVTLYDVDGARQAKIADALLVSKASAPFPLEVFTRAAASATHTHIPAFWKGSSLAILTLRDGTERRATFSYYGGFFALQGTAGHFQVPGAEESEFHTTQQRIVEHQLLPRRTGN